MRVSKTSSAGASMWALRGSGPCWRSGIVRSGLGQSVAALAQHAHQFELGLGVHVPGRRLGRPTTDPGDLLPRQIFVVAQHDQLAVAGRQQVEALFEGLELLALEIRRARRSELLVGEPSGEV